MVNVGTAICFVNDDQISICQGLTDFTFRRGSVVQTSYVQRTLYIEGRDFQLELKCHQPEALEFSVATGIPVRISNWENPHEKSFSASLQSNGI